MSDQPLSLDEDERPRPRPSPRTPTRLSPPAHQGGSVAAVFLGILAALLVAVSAIIMLALWFKGNAVLMSYWGPIGLWFLVMARLVQAESHRLRK